VLYRRVVLSWPNLDLISAMSEIDFAGQIPFVRAPTAQTATPQRATAAWSVAATASTSLGLTLFGCLALGLWWGSDLVVPWDSKNHFYPMFRYLAASLQRGEWPLWNPYHFGGHPSVADPQSLLFSPTMVIFALAAPLATMAQFDLFIFAHLLAGGLGVIALFRKRAWHPAGAFLAACLYMLGGAASSRLQHTGMILSYAFFPLALLALENALERPAVWRAIVFAITAALMALGRDQVAYLFCLTLLGAVVSQMACAERPWRWLGERLPWLVFMALLAFAVIAIPCLLTLQFLSQSNRPGIAYGVAVAGSLAPVNFITLIAPNFFGSLDWTYQYFGPGYETMTEPDWTDRAVNYLFIGTLPLVLIVWQGLLVGRLWRAAIRPAAWLALAAIIYALGHYTPLFAIIFDHVPGVRLYRRPADATFALNFAFAAMAGYLLHLYIIEGLAKSSRGVARMAAWCLAGVLALLIAAALALSRASGHLDISLVTLAGAAAAVLFVVAMLVIGERRQCRTLVAVCLVGLAACELLWRNAASSLNAEPTARYAVYDHLAPVEQEGLEALRADMAGEVQKGRNPRVEILGLGGAWQNASMVLELENTLGYNPLRIAEYERAIGPGENAGDPNLRHFPGTFRGYKCKLASLLGLQYLVLDRPLARLPRHIPRPKANLIHAAPGMYIYKLGTATPRAYLATKVSAIDSQAAIDDKAMPEFDRAHEALVDEKSLPFVRGDYGADHEEDSTSSGADPSSANSHVAIAAYHATSVLIEVDTDRPGILVLHDLYYPGWTVSVDGQNERVLRANLLFRGVEVAAGHHVVEFRFEPFALDNLVNAAQDVVGAAHPDKP
jgi:hypothetical protein